MLQRLEQWAREIKLDVVAIGIAARDPRVPWYVKLLAAAIVPGLMEEFRAEAAGRARRPTSRVGAAFVVAVWVGALAVVAWWMSRR